MPDMYNNKVVLASGEVLIDLTADTAVQNKVLSGYTFHDASGAPVTGNCAFDVDSSGATATQAEVLATKTFAKNGSVLTGTMPNNGGVTGTISTKAGQYTIPLGYHDGSGKVGISSTEQAKIIADNIKAGVQILGVTGTYSGEAIAVTTASVNPTFTAQTVLPPSGYDYLSQVDVAAIAVTKTQNAQGGYTVTIGSVA